MKIVILGAGTVGLAVAEALYPHRHDVTIIEKDAGVVRHLRETVDARIVEGSASHSTALFQADIMNADLCLAMTNSDETNILAASMAKTMGARRCIARIFSPMFLNLGTFDYHSFFHIDRLLSLEQLTALRLAREIDQYTGVLSFEHISSGGIALLEFLVPPKAPCIGRKISEMNFVRGVRVGTIRQGGQNKIPTADHVFRPGDQLAVIGSRDALAHMRKILGAEAPKPKNIVIGGGGETGFHLALQLQKTHRVRLMDVDRARCEALGGMLENVEILNADVQKRSSLEEYVPATDVFIACTGRDENNLLACVEAKALGTKEVFSVINRPDYGNVVKKLGIDFAVSPREMAVREVMKFLNTGAVISSDSPLGLTIRLLELEVQENSPISKVALQDAKLPPQCVVLAATHKGSVCVPGAKFRFAPGATAIVVSHCDKVDQILEKFEK